MSLKSSKKIAPGSGVGAGVLLRQAGGFERVRSIQEDVHVYDLPRHGTSCRLRSRILQYPAGSGMCVSVLLRQPYGFEGLSPIDDIFEPNHLPVAVCNDERRRDADLHAAPLPRSRVFPSAITRSPTPCTSRTWGGTGRSFQHCPRGTPGGRAAAIEPWIGVRWGMNSIFSDYDPGLEVTALECFKVAQEGIHVFLRQGRGLAVLNRGQRGGTVSENAPADRLAPKRRVWLCVQTTSTPLPGMVALDLRVEDDVLPGVAEVAVDPAVVLPFLDPATEELAEAVKPAEDAEPWHVHAGCVDFDVRVQQTGSARPQTRGCRAMASVFPASAARMDGATSTPCRGSFVRRTSSTFSSDIAPTRGATASRASA